MAQERLFEEHGLFASGVGNSTASYLRCGLCGTEYNTHDKDSECDMSGPESEWVRHTNFAGLEIAECCYGRIEKAVLDRRTDVLGFICRIIARERTVLRTDEALLSQLESRGKRDVP